MGKYLLLLMFVMSNISCMTVPPVYIYNRAYVGPKFAIDSSKSHKLAVVLDKTTSDVVKLSNYRYLYGAFLGSLEDLTVQSKKRVPNPPKLFDFEVLSSKPHQSSFDYVATIEYSNYGGRDATETNIEGEKTRSLKGPSNCFLLEVRIQSVSSKNNVFVFKSNGCPGMDDPRLIASKVFDILFSDMWPKDTTKTYQLLLSGASSDSWFSDLVTHPKVDKVLGF